MFTPHDIQVLIAFAVFLVIVVVTWPKGHKKKITRSALNRMIYELLDE